MDDTTKYRDLFFEETDEYLQTLNECILELEEHPEEKGLLDEIFRSAHTLKGMAATMGYKTMTELTHSMENVFELFKNGTLKITAETITLIFSCLDKLAEIVEDLRGDIEKEYDISEILKSLEALSSGEKDVKNETDDGFSIISLNSLDNTLRMLINNGKERSYDAYNIAVKLDEKCTLKGARSYLIINRLEQIGDVIHLDPPAEKLEEGNFDRVFRIIFLSQLSLDEVKENINDNVEIEDIIVEEIDLSKAQEFTPKIEEIAEEVKDGESVKEESDTKESSSSKSGNHAMNQSIRVDLSRLDRFMNLVSELVIYRTRLEDLSTKYKATEIYEPLENVERITSELQDLVLKIRMQPVKVVLNRFPRMIRDLSQELDKDLELLIEGEETELDRTVVSELAEPLVHLIRNAADHGIESREARRELGKAEKGLINLTAYQEGNRVILIVKDDGRGINPEIIEKSAARKGIETKGLSERDMINLIFHPGFSTVEHVTNVSGRGVGMDVVKQKITSLGGTIDVESKIDEGSTFTIKLPLTLSIIQALMVNIGEETFALPLGIIEKIVKVEKEEIVLSHDKEIYVYREKMVPVIRINEKLGIESTRENNHLILITLGHKYYALLVDDLIGQQEIAIKKLSGTLGNMKEYLGATILGNGDITLILDVGNLCKEEGE
ncbi:chemotaxis protein CheA [Tissierella creatinophila]|uniref:Chemotaxis protein CheA n=1 Tax=Tissierella creatinophila DSM 6911 TaxID=1123403 RepID=A0A1U7M2L3_TISCR|nr:chemotaxis protein CheA [Tissierella creatinophila]OLS01531.1 chemotaxis protein CheA [Tissierella creatinophila DSM 6911]